MVLAGYGSTCVRLGVVRKRSSTSEAQTHTLSHTHTHTHTHSHTHIRTRTHIHIVYAVNAWRDVKVVVRNGGWRSITVLGHSLSSWTVMRDWQTSFIGCLGYLDMCD